MFNSVKQAAAITGVAFLLLIQGCMGVQPYQTISSAAEKEPGYQHEPIKDVDAVNCDAASTCLLFAEYDGFGRDVQ